MTTRTDHELLVQASRLYYELGETQHAVAERLGVTRPQVSRLLKRARAEGVVEIRIIDSVNAASPAADRLQQRYGLDAVHVAPTLLGPDDLTRRMVGRLAADVLRTVVRDGQVVGIGDGASVGAVADALDDAATPVRATFVPLAGGYWSTGPDRDPFRRIADAFGGRPHGLMAPGLLDDAGTRRALESHAGVTAVLELWQRLDVALFGIGGPSWSTASVGTRAARDLEREAAVGEILIAPFDIAGRFVCPRLRERVIAFDARQLGALPAAIGVGSGPRKVRPIVGALRSGAVRTLVTDVATAEAVYAFETAELDAPDADEVEAR
jgi:DNA-binding transcriptional regulator LsrR (DeoR family)